MNDRPDSNCVSNSDYFRGYAMLFSALFGIGVLAYGGSVPFQLAQEGISRRLGARDTIQRARFVGNNTFHTCNDFSFVQSAFQTPEGELFYTADVPQLLAGKRGLNTASRKLKEGTDYDLQLVSFPDLNRFNVLVRADKASEIRGE